MGLCTIPYRDDTVYYVNGSVILRYGTITYGTVYVPEGRADSETSPYSTNTVIYIICITATVRYGTVHDPTVKLIFLIS